MSHADNRALGCADDLTSATAKRVGARRRLSPPPPGTPSLPGFPPQGSRVQGTDRGRAEDPKSRSHGSHTGIPAPEQPSPPAPPASARLQPASCPAGVTARPRPARAPPSPPPPRAWSLFI